MERSLGTLVLFSAILGSVTGLIDYYLWVRLVRSPDLAPTWQRYGTIGAFAVALLVPLGLFASPFMPRWGETLVATLAYGWMGVAIILFFLLAGSELLRLALHVGASVAGAPIDEARRTFLSRMIAAGAAGLGLILSGWGLASALGEVSIHRVRVPLRRLPRELDGFRIAQLTDVHIGPTLGREWLAGIVATVQAEKPDLVVITGDLVDGSVSELRDHVAPLAFLSAPYGVYFVTGNHEYYSGVEEWIEELSRLGIRVLRNERVCIGEEGGACFDLAGVDDWSAKRHGNGHGADLGRALAGREPSRELLLLAHQPKQIEEAREHGVGLQLSGHTHGGQIFPWGYFVRIDQPFVRGLSQAGDTHIYVSSGTGYWGPPMRVGAPPEIALLELIAPAAT